MDFSRVILGIGQWAGLVIVAAESVRGCRALRAAASFRPHPACLSVRSPLCAIFPR